MAIPKGKRTVWNEAEPQTELEQIRLVCLVTKKSFDGYDGDMPISKEGWTKLTKKQKEKLADGVAPEKVIK